MEITVLREETLYEAKKLWRESIAFVQTPAETQLKVRLPVFGGGRGEYKIGNGSIDEVAGNG